MIDYGNILTIFYKNKSWKIENSIDYSTLAWYDSSPKPTKEELDAQWEEVLSTKSKQDCKAQAKRLLSDSDWSELPSVVEALENADEWKSYRVQLRKYVVTPVQNPVFPSVPQVKWKE